MTEQAPPVEEAVVEEPAKEEIQEAVSQELAPANDDSLAARVADIVYEKMKVFTTDLLTASRDAVVAAQAAAPPMDNTPPPPVAEPEPDSKPQRRHRMFGQPLKRGE